jgi:glycosyltransferase involved in cell wall biosynthesis
MIKTPVSVIINTFNEEKNIRNCLETVKWADEIIVVDMYSEDRTVEIVKEYTDKIFFFKRLGYADPARQFALEKAANDWILSIDADELVPIKLKNKLINIMRKDEADIVYTPHNNYLFGHLLEFTGWGAKQDMHVRFFKKNFLNYTEDIHNFVAIKDNARIYKIKDPEEGFVHLAYLDVEHFIEKMNRYTTIEAKRLFDAGEDINSKQLLKRILDEFKFRYMDLKGYKEGFRGFSLSMLMAMYRLVTYMKLKLMRKHNSKGPREKIREKYNKIALEIIEEYANEK